jgi:hypothetical protein
LNLFNFYNQHSIMKNLYFFCFLFLALSSKAQFSGSYAPSQWTTTLTTGFVNTASVNSASAPASITITGSNDPNDPFLATPVDIDYTITAAASGMWSFNWAYQTNDADNDPKWDLAGVLINGTFTQLSANTLNNISQSGTYSKSVTAGTTIGFRVRAVDNSYGNATFTITSFSAPAGVLPVKLSAFTAKPQGAAVSLQWTAATEINTSHYAIERSAGGAGFRSVGRVAAGATSGQYAFLDQSPLPGTNYYRLRMEDNDGSFSYSGIRSVNLSVNHEQQVYPNPATDFVTLVIKADVAASETLQVYNAAGNLLKKETIALTPGTTKKSLNIASLPKGVYWIKAQTAGWVQTFVKN